jgi:hypothetical protein
MAHFAQVVDGVVAQVIVADNKEWCQANLGGEWVQTSYNTHANQHPEGRPLHKNYAGIGYTFDGIGFAAPQPYSSWSLNADSYLWEAPTPMPVEEGKAFTWDEPTLAWVEVELPA